MSESEKRDATVRLALKCMRWTERPFIGRIPARNYYDSEGLICMTAWNDNYHPEQVEGWYPWESWSDAGMLADAIHRLPMGYRLCLQQESDGEYHARFSIDLTPGHSPHGPEAIAMAALSVADREERCGRAVGHCSCPVENGFDKPDAGVCPQCGRMIAGERCGR